MGKMLKFKEYSEQFDELAESVELTEEEQSHINEALSTSARLRRRNQFINRRARLKMQRKVQRMRLADSPRIKNRSVRRAKGLIIKRIYQGRSRSQIPLTQRGQVDKKLEQLRPAVNRLSLKLIRRVRQEDQMRRTHGKLQKFNFEGQVSY
jgi:hypothetical protein